MNFEKYKNFFKHLNKWDYIKFFSAAIVLLIVFVILVSSAIGTKSVFADDFNNKKHDFDVKSTNHESSSCYISNGGMDSSSCLVLQNKEAGDSQCVRDIYLQARRHYKVTVYVRTQDIYGVGASVQIHKLSKSTGDLEEKIVLTDGANSTKYVTSGGWEKVEFNIPETSMSYKYQLVLRLGDDDALTSGTAYFDNVTVEKVSALNEGTFHDVRVLSCIVVVMLLFVFFVAYRYSRKYDLTDGRRELEHPAGGSFNLTSAIVVLFIAAFLLRIFLAVTYYQCDIDVNLFKSWGDVAYSEGIADIYNRLGANIDYPPIVVYFLWFASAMEVNFGSIFGLNHEYFHTVMVKLPSILCDMAMGYVIYRYAKKYNASTEWTIFVTSLWLFNPLSLIDSACWGQVDSMLALAVVLSIIFLNKKKYITAGIMFGLGVVLKPQMFFFLPVFGYMWLKDVLEDKNAFKALKTLLGSIGGALVGVVIPCLPFLHMGYENVTILGKAIKVPWIFSLFIGTANHYEYACVNSYNMWFMLGKNWVKDSTTLLEIAQSAEHPSKGLISFLSYTPLGSITLFSIGIFLIVLVSLVALVFALLLKKGEHLPYLLSAFMFAAVPFFAPRMHERYFFPALVLLIISLVIYNKKIFLIPVGLLSTSGFLIVTDVLLGLSVGGNLKALGQPQSVYADYYWPSWGAKPDSYRMLLSLLMCLAVLSILVIMIFCVIREKKPNVDLTLGNIFSGEKQDPVDELSDVISDDNIDVVILPRAKSNSKVTERGGRR